MIAKAARNIFELIRCYLIEGSHLLSKHGFRVLCCFIAFLLIISSIHYLGAKSDETKYHQLVRQIRYAQKIRSATTWLPRLLSRPLGNILNRPMQRYIELEPQLFASGFLTNMSIRLSETYSRPNLPGSGISEIQTRINKLGPRDFLPAELVINSESNLVILNITCPVSDVPILERAFAD